MFRTLLFKTFLTDNDKRKAPMDIDAKVQSKYRARPEKVTLGSAPSSIDDSREALNL
jgi:hypothetical protein